MMMYEMQVKEDVRGEKIRGCGKVWKTSYARGKRNEEKEEKERGIMKKNDCLQFHNNVTIKSERSSDHYPYDC